MGQSTAAGKVTPKRALVEQIERAFASIPYPGDDRICAGVTDEARRLGTEEAEIEAAFRGRHWKDVPVEVLNRHYDALSFLSPEAFRYFLPAYVLAALGVPRWPPGLAKIGYGIRNAVVWSLIPPPLSHGLGDHFLERVKGFSPDQKAAMRAFLQWLDKEEGGTELELDPSKTRPLSDAARALRRYWDRAE